jgi:hypothetical protein
LSKHFVQTLMVPLRVIYLNILELGSSGTSRFEVMFYLPPCWLGKSPNYSDFPWTQLKMRMIISASHSWYKNFWYILSLVSAQWKQIPFFFTQWISGLCCYGIFDYTYNQLPRLGKKIFKYEDFIVKKPCICLLSLIQQRIRCRLDLKMFYR